MAKGVFQPSRETLLVYEYQTKKMLNKLGYTFPISDLSDNDVNVYNVIEDEIAKIKKEDLKKMRRK